MHCKKTHDSSHIFDVLNKRYIPVTFKSKSVIRANKLVNNTIKKIIGAYLITSIYAREVSYETV